MDAKSQRSRIRPTRIRVGSTQARISDRREFASIGRKVASIARVGSVDRPPPARWSLDEPIKVELDLPPLLGYLQNCVATLSFVPEC